MGDEQDCGAGGVDALVEVIEDPFLHGDVESAGGLVGDHQFRGARQRDADEDALPLPTGQLRRVLAGAELRAVDARLVQDADRVGGRGTTVGPAVDPQDLGHLVADAPHRVEGRRRILGYDTDV